MAGFNEQDHPRDEGGKFSVGDRVKHSSGMAGKVTESHPAGWHTIADDKGNQRRVHESSLTKHTPTAAPAAPAQPTAPAAGFANGDRVQHAKWGKAGTIVSTHQTPTGPGHMVKYDDGGLGSHVPSDLVKHGAPAAPAPPAPAAAGQQHQNAMDAAKAIGQGQKPPPGAGSDWATKALGATAPAPVPGAPTAAAPASQAGAQPDYRGMSAEDFKQLEGVGWKRGDPVPVHMTKDNQLVRTFGGGEASDAEHEAWNRHLAKLFAAKLGLGAAAKADPQGIAENPAADKRAHLEGRQAGYAGAGDLEGVRATQKLLKPVTPTATPPDTRGQERRATWPIDRAPANPAEAAQAKGEAARQRVGPTTKRYLPPAK